VSYVVERVEWKDEAAAVSALLAQAFPCVPITRYAWLHEMNPAGPGALWLARDAAGRAVGTAAVHRRRILIDGHAHRAGLPADFVVARDVRGFGPALALQRAVLAACENGDFDFLYGFPNRAAKPVFERIGYRVGDSRRLARPLRLSSYLSRGRRWRSLVSVFAGPLDHLLHLLSRETYGAMPRRAHVEPLEHFGPEFDAFWKRARIGHAVIGDRDATYMNWRYGKSPTRRYDVIALRQDAEILATIVSYRIGNVVFVADALARDASAFDAIFAAFLRAQRRAGLDGVSLIAMGDLGVAAGMEKYGFIRREVERTMMVYLPAAAAPPLTSLERWCLFEGDVL
jgi:hypothetical protein